MSLQNVLDRALSVLTWPRRFLAVKELLSRSPAASDCRIGYQKVYYPFDTQRFGAYEFVVLREAVGIFRFNNGQVRLEKRQGFEVNRCRFIGAISSSGSIINPPTQGFLHRSFVNNRSSQMGRELFVRAPWNFDDLGPGEKQRYFVGTFYEEEFDHGIYLFRSFAVTLGLTPCAR